MGQGGDFLQRKKYDLDACHGYDKNHHVSGGTIVFLVVKMGVFGWSTLYLYIRDKCRIFFDRFFYVKP